METLLVRAARGERTARPPVWLMRQAGRHLPEYRALRESHTFREAISTPEVAERISLQPYERYGVDGVVMFSDILVVLEPLGFDYHVESGVGPVVENPVEDPEDVHRDREAVAERLAYVGDLLDRLRGAVDEETAVIGFAGGPLSLASYVIAGGSSRGNDAVRQFRARHPDAFRTLLETFADAVTDLLQYQVARGADVVQLFDTYAHVLGPADFREFVLPLHRRIFDAVDAPTIVFVRDVAGRLETLAETGADVVSLDWSVEMGAARETLGVDQPVQGNLDPAYLFGSESFVREQTRHVVEQAGPRGHVLNLGHGVHRDTPVEGVRAFVETAKEIEW